MQLCAIQFLVSWLALVILSMIWVLHVLLIGFASSRALYMLVAVISQHDLGLACTPVWYRVLQALVPVWLSAQACVHNSALSSPPGQLVAVSTNLGVHVLR